MTILLGFEKLQKPRKTEVSVFKYFFILRATSMEIPANCKNVGKILQKLSNFQAFCNFLGFSIEIACKMINLDLNMIKK